MHGTIESRNMNGFDYKIRKNLVTHSEFELRVRNSHFVNHFAYIAKHFYVIYCVGSQIFPLFFYCFYNFAKQFEIDNSNPGIPFVQSNKKIWLLLSIIYTNTF